MSLRKMAWININFPELYLPWGMMLQNQWENVIHMTKDIFYCIFCLKIPSVAPVDILSREKTGLQLVGNNKYFNKIFALTACIILVPMYISTNPWNQLWYHISLKLIALSDAPPDVVVPCRISENIIMLIPFWISQPVLLQWQPRADR